MKNYNVVVYFDRLLSAAHLWNWSKSFIGCVGPFLLILGGDFSSKNKKKHLKTSGLGYYPGRFHMCAQTKYYTVSWQCFIHSNLKCCFFQMFFSRLECKITKIICNQQKRLKTTKKIVWPAFGCSQHLNMQHNVIIMSPK